MALAQYLSAHDTVLLASGFLVSLVFCSVTLLITPLRPAAHDRRSLARTGCAGLLLGGTVWTVLFLSWKGFFPFVDVLMPLSAVAASAALAIVGATATLVVSVHGDPGIRNTVLAGSILAATVS